MPKSDLSLSGVSPLPPAPSTDLLDEGVPYKSGELRSNSDVGTRLAREAPPARRGGRLKMRHFGEILYRRAVKNTEALRTYRKMIEKIVGTLRAT